MIRIILISVFFQLSFLKLNAQLIENPLQVSINKFGEIELKNLSSSHEYLYQINKKSVKIKEYNLKPNSVVSFSSGTTKPRKLYHYAISVLYNQQSFEADKSRYKNSIVNSFNSLIDKEAKCKSEIDNKSAVTIFIDEFRLKKQKIWDQEAKLLLNVIEQVENTNLSNQLINVFTFSEQQEIQALEKKAILSSKNVKYNWGCYATTNSTIAEWGIVDNAIKQAFSYTKEGEKQKNSSRQIRINSETLGIKSLKLNRRPISLKLDGFYIPIGKHTYNATGEITIPLKFYPQKPTKRGVFLTLGGSIFTDGLISSPKKSAQQVLIEQYNKDQNQYSKAILLNRVDTLQRWYLMNQRQIFYLGLDFEKNKIKWRNSFGLGVAMDFKGNTRNLFGINSLQFYKGILSEKYSLEILPSFFNYGSLNPYFKVNLSRKINKFIDFTISSKTLINLKSLTWIQEFRPFYGEDISSERIPFNNFQGTNLGIGFRLNL